MNLDATSPFPTGDGSAPPEVEVVIEIPKGSFIKRGSTGHVDFVSPLPCPFNYGSVPSYVGLEGDLLDAVVLGPRLRVGTVLRIKAWGAVTLTDRGMSDDKLVCSTFPLSDAEKRNVLRFFRHLRKVQRAFEYSAASTGPQCMRWLAGSRTGPSPRPATG